jgi:hypothetical protein
MRACRPRLECAAKRRGRHRAEQRLTPVLYSRRDGAEHNQRIAGLRPSFDRREIIAMEVAGQAVEERSVDFHVSTDDPDIVAWLRQFPEEQWGERATTALRVGVLALIDREAIRQEGKDLTHSIEQRVTEALGRLVGPESSLVHLLDPRRTDGLVEQMRQAVDGELAGNSEKVLAAFDLNEPDSALSRLVEQVRGAQRAIRGDFTLDDPESALSRMLAQLRTTLDTYEERNRAFRVEVESILRDMTVRKEAEDRGTIHGAVFEDAVTAYVLKNASETSDIGRHTGSTTGIIKNCKVGDCVVELGPDSPFAGESIVIEAKEDASYDLKRALEEIDKGRRNRGADVGIFVFSKKTAPRHLGSLARHGRDITVVWDAEDPATDVCFDAALTLARAMIFDQHRRGHVNAEVDFVELDRAVESIAKRASSLDDIRTWGQTVENTGGKIVAEIDRAQKDLVVQVEKLREQVAQARRALGSQPS